MIVKGFCYIALKKVKQDVHITTQCIQPCAAAGLRFSCVRRVTQMLQMHPSTTVVMTCYCHHIY